MPATPSESLVLTFEEARRVVEEHASLVSAGAHGAVDLLHSADRILAESVSADRDIPPFRRSTRDGYAIRSADLAQLPATLRVIGEIKAGPRSGKIPPLKAGEALSIMTGAPVPPGADAVVMVEYTSLHTDLQNIDVEKIDSQNKDSQNKDSQNKDLQNKDLQADRVAISRSVTPGENIVDQGAEAKRGSLVIERGTRLKESDVALAASVGRSRLPVYVRPRIAVLTTGDEIVDVDSEISPTQIRNSNSYSLAVQIQNAGGEPWLLPIAPDEPGRLRELIRQGLQADLLLMTGGVSMGRYDLVEQVLTEMQAEFFFTGAKIQPGRPVVFGRVRTGKNAIGGSSVRRTSAHKYFFGLPGNPVSTMVTFELFARPVLEALAGMSPLPLMFLHARLKSDIRVKTGLKRFLPAVLSGRFEDTCVELVPWQGSGDIAARSRSNCLIVIPADREHISAGEWIAVLPHR